MTIILVLGIAAATFCIGTVFGIGIGVEIEKSDEWERRHYKK